MYFLVMSFQAFVRFQTFGLKYLISGQVYSEMIL